MSLTLVVRLKYIPLVFRIGIRFFVIKKLVKVVFIAKKGSCNQHDCISNNCCHYKKCHDIFPFVFFSFLSLTRHAEKKKEKYSFFDGFDEMFVNESVVKYSEIESPSIFLGMFRRSSFRYIGNLPRLCPKA